MITIFVLAVAVDMRQMLMIVEIGIDYIVVDCMNNFVVGAVADHIELVGTDRIAVDLFDHIVVDLRVGCIAEIGYIVAGVVADHIVELSVHVAVVGLSVRIVVAHILLVVDRSFVVVIDYIHILVVVLVVARIDFDFDFDLVLELIGFVLIVIAIIVLVFLFK